MQFDGKVVFSVYFLILFCLSNATFNVVLMFAEDSTEDLIVEGKDVFTIDNVAYTQRGNVIVRENGTLIIRNSGFELEQTVYERYKMTIRDNGTLRIENSEINSTKPVEIVSYNSSQVYIIDSMIIFEPSNVIAAFGESKVLIENVYSTGHLDIDSWDSSNISIESSELYLLGTNGNSTVHVVDSLIKHDAWCRDSSKLFLQNSTISKEGLAGWLIAEDSTSVTVSNTSQIERVMTALDSSNITIDNAQVGTVQLKGASHVEIVNNSAIGSVFLSFSHGQSIVSNFKRGYTNENRIHEPRTGLNLTVIMSQIDGIHLKAGSNSHIFIVDSEIHILELSSYASAVIRNSQIDIVYCDNNSFVLVWNSRIVRPIQGQEEATVLYFSTIDIGIFNLIVGVLAIVLIVCISTLVVFLRRRQRHSSTSK